MSVPAKWHLIPSNGFNRVHKCDRHSDRHKDYATGIGRIAATFLINVDKAQHSSCSFFPFSLRALHSVCTHLGTSAAKLPDVFLALRYVMRDRMLRL